MSTAVNAYEISMDELRNLAESQPLSTPEGVTPPSVTEPVTQPRDEQGRFIKAEETVPPVDEITDPQTDPAAPVEEPAQYFHREEIDNGAGGKEVFEGIGGSPEEAIQACLQKVVESKGHATRKIRELTAAQKVVTHVDTTPNPDEEAALAQELLSEPTKALERFYAKRRSEERAAEAEAQRQAEQAKAAVDVAAAKFITANPDFYECPKNAARIAGWLRVNGKPENFDTIQEAYNDLNADGLLLPKPAPAAATTARSSGLSVRSNTTQPVKTAADVERELRSMPLDKLRDAIGYQNNF